MFRLLVLLAALLFVTPASAESAFEAAMRQALTEAHCPPYSRIMAVEAAFCHSTAMRPVMAQYAPASLVIFEAMMESNIESARKFEDGKITAEQYIAEVRAQWKEFAAKNGEGSLNLERCKSIIQGAVSQWITAGEEAPALEKLRMLGCLK
jgi:hypothetical protein